MQKTSAGLLMYRHRAGELQFLLVHPGGPFFRNKDEGAWTIPKGELEENEDGLDAAKREFAEETGERPEGRFIGLPEVRQKGGKRIRAWAVEGDLDPTRIKSNCFSMEWPPRSGQMQEFPEIDRAEWFNAEMAKSKINPAQRLLLEETERLVRSAV